MSPPKKRPNVKVQIELKPDEFDALQRLLKDSGSRDMQDVFKRGLIHLRRFIETKKNAPN